MKAEDEEMWRKFWKDDPVVTRVADAFSRVSNERMRILGEYLRVRADFVLTAQGYMDRICKS